MRAISLLQSAVNNTCVIFSVFPRAFDLQSNSLLRGVCKARAATDARRFVAASAHVCCIPPLLAARAASTRSSSPRWATAPRAPTSRPCPCRARRACSAPWASPSPSSPRRRVALGFAFCALLRCAALCCGCVVRCVVSRPLADALLTHRASPLCLLCSALPRACAVRNGDAAVRERRQLRPHRAGACLSPTRAKRTRAVPLPRGAAIALLTPLLSRCEEVWFEYILVPVSSHGAHAYAGAERPGGQRARRPGEQAPVRARLGQGQLRRRAHAARLEGGRVKRRSRGGIDDQSAPFSSLPRSSSSSPYSSSNECGIRPIKYGCLVCLLFTILRPEHAMWPEMQAGRTVR